MVKPRGESDERPHSGAEAQGHPLVVVVGSINADQVVRVERRPGPGETVGGASLELLPGGKGANQAVAAARCGATVAMVGLVGDDELGRAQLAALLAEQVEVSNVRATASAPTGLALVLLTPDGENSIAVVPGANERLTPADVELAAPLLGAAAVLVTQLEIPLEAVARAVGLAGDRTLVVLNCAPARILPASVLAATDVLVVNEHEAAALTGRGVQGAGGSLEAAAELLGMGPSSVVVTLGAEGAVVLDGARRAAGDEGGEGARVAPPRVQVLDTTGAGDAFVGALAAALGRGWPLLDAVRFGVAVGSATTTRRGARAVVPTGLLARTPARGPSPEPAARRGLRLSPADAEDEPTATQSAGTLADP